MKGRRPRGTDPPPPSPAVITAIVVAPEDPERAVGRRGEAHRAARRGPRRSRPRTGGRAEAVEDRCGVQDRLRIGSQPAPNRLLQQESIRVETNQIRSPQRACQRHGLGTAAVCWARVAGAPRRAHCGPCVPHRLSSARSAHRHFLERNDVRCPLNP